MSFNPHIIPADDAPLDDDGSLQLPADLSELAAQLSDDANYLASLYPAKPAINAPQAKPLAAPRLTRYAALAIVALLAVLPISGWWLQKHITWRERSPAVVTVHLADPAAISVMNHEEHNESFPVSFELPDMEGFLLHEYSGPELEGVYDLLAEAPQAEISF